MSRAFLYSETKAGPLWQRMLTALDPDAVWRGLLAGLLDGTTLRLRSLGDIPKRFPPHGNQCETPAYWCLMRAVADFCAFTGAAMDCRLAPSTSSEQELACEIILAKTSGPRLFIGDRNFGVFRVAQTALRSGSHALVRMAKNEWLAGLLADNLVRASMLCAALRARVPALSLSFSPSCRHLLNWLARWSQILPHLSGDWEKLLDLIARSRLPKRSKPRPAEPRAQRHLRQSFPPLIGSRADARKKLIAPNHEC